MDEFVFGSLFGALVAALVATLALNTAWHRETVARGFALYCPENGQWAWVGECGE